VANATIRDSTATNPGGTGSTITVTLPTHAAGDIILIAVGNTGNTLWTGNPAGWNRIQQLQVGTAANGLLGTYFYRRVLSGDSLPLTNPAFTLGATVSRMAIAYALDGASEEGVMTLLAWAARGLTTGTANPVRPPSTTTSSPEMLALHIYFSKAATNAPDPSGYTQDEEIVISGTLVGNGSNKTVADQNTALTSQDASPTSGVRWVAGLFCIPSDDYPFYRSAAQATATATSVTPALPSGTTDTDVLGNKDVLIATVEGAGSTTLSMTDGAWTEIATWETTTSGGGSTVSKFWAYASGTLNRQANRTGSAEISAQICTFYNCKQTNPIGAVNVRQNASSTTSTWDALTRTATKCIIQSTCIADGIPTFTSPSGWNERTDGLGISTGDQVFNASGSTASASFTLSAGSPTAVGLVEIIGAASVIEHARSSAVDAAASIAASGTFFSVFSLSGTADGSASITVSGVRQVSRSAVIEATGDITSSGIASSPSETFERSASVGCTSVVESSATGFSVLSGSALIDAIATVESSGQFFSILSSSLSFDAAGEISSTALFFSVFERSTTIDLLGALESSAQFFSELSASVTVLVTVGIETAAVSFREVQSSALLNIAGEIASAGEIDPGAVSHERLASLVVVAGIESDGIVFSVIERAILCEAQGGIAVIGRRSLFRSVSLEALGLIAISGVTPSVEFYPTRLAKVAKEVRSQSIGTEYRTL
jgi:hypothetical protein